MSNRGSKKRKIIRIWCWRWWWHQIRSSCEGIVTRGLYSYLKNCIMPTKGVFGHFLQKPSVPNFSSRWYKIVSSRAFQRCMTCQWYILFDLDFVLHHCGWHLYTVLKIPQKIMFWKIQKLSENIKVKWWKRLSVCLRGHSSTGPCPTTTYFNPGFFPPEGHSPGPISSGAGTGSPGKYLTSWFHSPGALASWISSPGVCCLRGIFRRGFGQGGLFRRGLQNDTLLMLKHVVLSF